MRKRQQVVGFKVTSQEWKTETQKHNCFAERKDRRGVSRNTTDEITVMLFNDKSICLTQKRTWAEGEEDDSEMRDH